MYLKRLEVQGFKSFADKTVIKFESGITGVVGPNGSGKSNISDSIRWVLGEQSVKSLRGSKMEDVIFSGASGRKPLGFAEVTMVLDNSTGIFPIEYEELAVTRRMFRSGESEYYINRNSCRLRDIRELFMDTGIGKDGYSIIGQGRIDDMLSSKSEDRRRIFEEAAGIVKYKSRKEESERKLQRTKDNLVRIDDIVSELEKQVGPLKEQSEKAKRYLEVSESHRSLDLELFRLEFEGIKAEEEKYDEEIEKKSFRLMETSSEKDRLREEAEREEERGVEIEEELAVKGEERYGILSCKEKLEGEIKLYEEKIKTNSRDIERIEAEKAELKREFEYYSRDVGKKEILKAEYLHKLSEQNSHIEEREERLSTVELKVGAVVHEVEQKKGDTLERLNMISEQKLRLNTLDSHMENLKLREEQIARDVEKTESKKGEISDINRELKEKLDGFEESLGNLEHDIAENQSSRAEKLAVKRELQVSLEKLKSGIQSRESNLKFLKEMKEEYEGYYKGVKNFLTQSKNVEKLSDGIDGLVAELATVKKEHEKAIEVALGGSLQNIVVESQNHGKLCIEFLKERKLGRITFLPRDSIKGKSLNAKEETILKEDGVIGVASDIVEYDEKYSDIFKNLLGRTIVIDDMDTMIRVSKKYGNSLKLVTVEGDVLNPGGSMTGGSFRGNSLSLLGRERQIKELEDGIVSGKVEYREKAESYSAVEAEIENLDAAISEYQKLDQQIRFEKNGLESQYVHTMEQERELSKGSEGYRQETEQIARELSKIEVQRVEIEDAIVEHQKKIDEMQSEVEAKNRSLESERSEMAKENGALVELKIERASIEENVKSLESEIERIQRELEKSVQKTEKLEGEREKLKLERIQTEGEIDSAKGKITELLKSISSVESQMDSLKESKERVSKKLKEIESKLKQVEFEFEKTEKEKHALQLNREKAELKLDSMRERIWEEYELSYSMVLNLEQSGKERSDIERELQNSKSELKRIGSVNLEAIEEYERVSERHSFLEKQRDDLVEAEKSLKHVIKEMNHKMKEQFKYKFEEIKVQFSEIFIQLFGGGRADINLEEPENILESGIEIIAQPPGKKLQSLSLLSGGERALTAIGILFAILKTRPTPFCILDEIEAALDESNVYRYAEYLESFAKDTQFVVITHRKGTMESADSLYGVTMEEDGISKILSVKLTDKLIEESSRG